MLHFSKRLFIVNLLGALFYLGCLMQWMWSLLPFMPGIIQFTEMLRTPADTPAEPVVPIIALAPSPITTILSVAVVVIVISVVIYILIKAPATVGKTGQKLTTKASDYIVPAVSHHKKLSPKKRQRLTARVIVYLKISLSVLPVILGSCAYFITTDLPYDIIMLVAAIIGVITLITLCLQLSLTTLLKVSPEKTW